MLMAPGACALADAELRNDFDYVKVVDMRNSNAAEEFT